MSEFEPDTRSSIAVIISDADHYLSLLSGSYSIAKAREVCLVVFVITSSDKRPDWFTLPDKYEDTRLDIRLITGSSPVKKILKDLKVLQPELLGLPLAVHEKDGRHLSGETLDPILQRATCPIFLLKAPSEWELPSADSALVPFWNDTNSRFAIDTGLEIDPNLHITAARVVRPPADNAERQQQQEDLTGLTDRWQDNPRFQAKLLFGVDELKVLLDEAGNYDFLLVGADRGHLFTRAIFGDSRHQLVNRSPRPAVILREYQGRVGSFLFRAWSAWDKVLPRLTQEDRVEAYRSIRRGGRPNRDFYTMIAMSAGIASLGLILDSAAVIIGAMLVAPLMSAIIGMGLATVQGDFRFLMLTLRATLSGALAAIGTGALLGLIHFGGEATSQMLQRTEPTPLDMAVALLSGIAAAYALCRKNVSNALPGVAIAVALVPPLATVGVSLSGGKWNMAWGAFELFLSNMVGIIFASALVFASFGFKPGMAPGQDHRRIKIFQRSFLGAAFLVILLIGVLAGHTIRNTHRAALKDQVKVIIERNLSGLGISSENANWKVTRTSKDILLLKLELKAPREITQKEMSVLQKEFAFTLQKPLVLDLRIIPVTLHRFE
jgi:uncharacterized hydrophobic protein (TIGR00271 family)